MSMLVEAKIGTMPGEYVFLKSIRKLPRIGQIVQYKEMASLRGARRPVPEPGTRWRGGRVWKVDYGRVFIEKF